MKQSSNKDATDKLLKTLELLEERICGRCRLSACNNGELVQCGDVRLLEQAKEELAVLVNAGHKGNV